MIGTRLKYMHLKSILYICCAVALASCSSTRYVPDDAYLVKKNIVTLKSTSHASRSDLKSLIKQQTNSKVLGFPVKLKLYSLSNPNKNNAWHRFLRRIGEAPVIFDTTLVERSISQMNAYLMSKGFFESQIQVNYRTRRKKIKSDYNIILGPGYTIRNFKIEINDDSLSHFYPLFYQSSPIRSEQPYDAVVLNKLRADLATSMQNRGRYSFAREHVMFTVDTNIGDHRMDITLHILPPDTAMGYGSHHRQFRIGNVSIYPEYTMRSQDSVTLDSLVYVYRSGKKDTVDKPFTFISSEPNPMRPSATVSKLQLIPGEVFQIRNMDRTYDNLTEMRVFRYTNINTRPRITLEGDRLVDVRIETKQSSSHSWEAQAEVTTSSGLQGAAGNISYQNKNLFGGAEIFNLKFRGALELQYLFNKEKQKELNFTFINNFELNIEAGLELPRFLAPISISRFSPSFKPKTLISIGYNYQLKPAYYTRSIVNADIGYTWRKNRWLHALYPIEINVVKINLKPDFAAKIDTLTQLNKRLKYQYADHFILNSHYSFVYNEQIANRNMNFNYVRVNVEAAGNLLYLGSLAVNAKKNDLGQYRLFDMAYSQYLRLQVDAKRHFVLGRDQTMVLRGMIGTGFAFGNSKALPYEKGFFAGGTNNIRAWPLNLLGPGSYYDPSKPTIERVGDIVFVANWEYRFPIYSVLKGALFLDAGNIWLGSQNAEFPNGEFKFKRFLNDLAVGTGFGIRLDIGGLFLVRFDLALPLRDPADYGHNTKWTFERLKLNDIILNFGIGYPF